MSTWLEQFLIRYPELALFLVIAAGYWIGSFRIGPFSLGPITGALFAGLLVGQFAHVPVSGMTKSFLFLLFLFGVGYSVGPQFMQAVKRDGLAISEADRARFVAHVAVADAVCYIFGYAGVILFCTVVVPALLKIDLKA